jgi:acetoin:2,6-dichlorophenolindophenol oxidoreductase subunit alpha
MPGVIVDGFDFFAVHEALGEAIERARGGGGPTLIEVKLSRYFGHFEGDAQTYRAPGEVQKLRDEKDCLKRFEERVVRAEMLNTDDLRKIDSDVKALIDDSVLKAKAAPLPTEADLLTDVYVSYP